MSYSYPSMNSANSRIGMYGFEEFKSILQQLPQRVQYNVARTAVFRVAQAVRDQAKINLQANGNVRSDRKLLNSIKARRARDVKTGDGESVAAARVYSKVRYAHLIELGHTNHGENQTVQHVQAFPFLVPALESAREYLMDLLKFHLQQELGKAWDKHGLGKVPEPKLDEDE